VGGILEQVAALIGGEGAGGLPVPGNLPLPVLGDLPLPVIGDLLAAGSGGSGLPALGGLLGGR